MSSLTFSVKGMTPKPWGTEEWEWRRVLAETARTTIEKSLLTTVPADPRFRVKIAFIFTPDHARRSDLDNLAKPVLDTIFRPRHAQVADLSLTGALFGFDDEKVYELTLAKEIVPVLSEEGVRIEISWEDENTGNAGGMREAS